MKKTLGLVALITLTAIVVSAQDYPRVETFAGFTYTRANSASNVPAFSANGGGGQLAVNPNRWLGFVMDLGSVHNGNIGDNHLDSTFTNFLFGPRISLRYSRVRPYFNILFGGVHASTSIALSAVPVAVNLPANEGFPTAPPGSPVTLRASASQTAFAMTTGGGIDIKITRHVSFRPIGLDYLMTRLQNIRTAQDNNQHNLRYTAGFNFTFGGESPTPPPPPTPPPAMHSCWDGSSLPVNTPCPKRNVDLKPPAVVDLCVGAALNITAPGTPPADAAYEWTLNGQPLGKEAKIDFGTNGREPGPYKIGLTISAPDYNDATVERVVNVVPYRPPTGNLEASATEIWVGEKVNLAARFSPGQCGGDLRAPVFSASEGSVSGNVFDSTDVRFDPAATTEQRKSVTLLAKVADDKGEGSAQASLVVKKAVAVSAKRFPDIVFPNANARVNNCGKRVLLEELKAAIDSDPSGKVVLVGHVSAKEAGKTGLDQNRALNAAAVISAGQGICAAFPVSQIMVGSAGAVDNGVDYQSRFCGSTHELPGNLVKESESDARYRRVEVWFVPTGGALPASVKDPQVAASLPVSALGCPR